MSLINKVTVIILCGGLSLLLFSWHLRSFQLLLIASILFVVVVTIKLQKIRSVTIPIVASGIILSIGEFFIPFILQTNQTLVTYTPGSSYSDGSYYQRIPKFGYRLSPGVHTSGKLSMSGEIIYDVIYTIGSDGYRKDISVDYYDAFIYGGSYAFGEGLNDNETISYFLYKDYNISVKNVGVHGYGLHQALYNIQQGVTSSKQNGINILLTSPWHSLRSSCKKPYSDGTPRYVFEGGSLRLDGVCVYGDQNNTWSKVLSKSNVAQLIKRVANKNENIITNKDIKLYIEIIKEIKKLSDANDASLVIAYIGIADDRLSNTEWSNESLVIELSGIVDNLIDVSLTDERENLDSKFYIHELDQHPSALANERRAEALHAILRLNKE